MEREKSIFGVYYGINVQLHCIATIGFPSQFGLPYLFVNKNTILLGCTRYPSDLIAMSVEEHTNYREFSNINTHVNPTVTHLL